MAEIGPVLPPGFKPSSHSDSEDDQKSQGGDTQYIGPVLPPGFKKDAASDSASEDSSEDSDQSADESTRQSSIGPVLPPGFRQTADKGGPSTSSSGGADSSMGPALPPGFVIQRDSDSDDDDIIGPSPHVGPQQGGSVAEDFEKRAQRMKQHLIDKDKDVPQERETWMLELPPEMSGNIGLEARKFKRGAGGSSCGDRSVWTDTPADKEKRTQDAAEGKVKRKKKDETSHIVSARDQYLSEQVEEYNKSKRSKSLLAMHESKLKKKKKKEKKKSKKHKHDKDKDKPSRREFDREEDLKVNQFDDAMRKSVIKRSQQLEGRFSHGSSQFM